MARKLTLRSPEGEKRYNEAAKEKADLWDREAIFETEQYKIIPNKYPYDLAHERNVMLITSDGPDKAFQYAREFTDMHPGEYDQILWNTPNNQSQGHITHIHILRLRRVEQ